jgi:hypothetical protein
MDIFDLYFVKISFFFLTDPRPLSPMSALNPPITYTNHIYSNPSPLSHSTINNRNISHHPMSTSLYNYRPLVCRQMESSSVMSSSFHEQSHRSDPIIRPLSSSSSSMSTWTQSVRRLNTEYTSTINALQQAKESLKEIYPDPADTISKYANLVARGINNLSNNPNHETKKSIGVTFCLTAPISRESPLPSSKLPIQTNPNIFSSTMFCKPKLVRPMELDTFIQSNIIKKFNNLNFIPSSEKSSTVIDTQINKEQQREILPNMIIYDAVQSNNDPSNISPSTSLTDTTITTFTNLSPPRVHFDHAEPSITTYELEEIPYESPPPPLTSSSSSSSVSEDSTSSTTSTSDENQIYRNNQFDNVIEEETTYTVETFYKSANHNIKTSLPTNQQQLVVIREHTTEEQFNLAKEKQHEEINHQIPSQHTFTINETNVSPLTTPLLTYLNLSGRQSTPTPPATEKQGEIHEK